MTTDASANYQFVNVPGQYKIDVEKSGSSVSRASPLLLPFRVRFASMFRCSLAT